MRSRLPVYVASALLLGAALWPLTWPRGRDDFPLSPYPMFTARRDRTVTVRHVLAVDDRGVTRPLAPDVVANGAVMQAAATVRRAIAEGRAEALCVRIAARISPAERPREILVATSTFDMATYFAGARAPLSREVHARCTPAGGDAGGLR